MNDCLKDRLTHNNNEFDYSIDSVLLLMMIKENYVRMYERFKVELKSYMKAIRILSKGYLPISLIPPSKLEAILEQVKLALAKANKDYDLVLSRLYLYYDMKLVMFGIDDQKNSNHSIPGICTDLYSNKANFISNRDSASPNFRC